MKKAIAILQALRAKRSLKKICDAYNISYKYCHAVSEEEKKPSYDLIEKFRFLIPADFWFDDADQKFLDELGNPDSQ